MEKKEAMKILKDFHDKSALFSVRTALDTVFPELKESEDEKIRKWLIGYFQRNKVAEVIKTHDILAWLEKQGESKFYSWKPTKEQYEALDYAYNSCSDTERGNYYEGVLETLIEDLHRLEKQSEKPQGKTALEAAKEEKVDNQNCVKPTDRVEPKFQNGQWIVFNGLTLYVNEVVQGYYRTTSIGGIPNSYDWNIDNAARLWTIQEAKDGDVLVCPLPRGYEAGEQIFIFQGINSRDYVENCIEYYCRICEGVFYENKNGYMGTTSSPIYPASKTQRDLLFAKMHEAGYEWDGGKGLRKIEQKLSNSAKIGMDEESKWTEEDEQYLLVCKNALHKYQWSDKWDADIISKWLEDKLKQRMEE